MSKNFKNIFNKKKSKPYIIAEIGNNHNGSILLAKKLIIEAKRSGADCVKFQTFSTDSLFSKKSFKNNKKLKNDSDKYTLKINDFKKLKIFAKKNKIDFTATPFSKQEVDFLIYDLKLKFIKIASMDLNNYPLIEYIAKKKVSVIISTGFGSKNEIKRAISILKKNKVKYVILHCVSEYPPKEEKLNLMRIKELVKLFKCPVGFSDHTIGTVASTTALVLGAKIIEKHFTLDKKMKGWDHSISSNPIELKMICDFSKVVKKILGKSKITRVEKLKNSKIFRRSIVAANNLKKGKKILFNDLNFKRPGDGLDPIMWKKIIGKRLKNNIGYDKQILLRDIIK